MPIFHNGQESTKPLLIRIMVFSYNSIITCSSNSKLVSSQQDMMKNIPFVFKSIFIQQCSNVTLRFLGDIGVHVIHNLGHFINSVFIVLKYSKKYLQVNTCNGI